MTIIVKDLTRIYGSQKAVNNLSFSVSKGEIVGFLGPNGAGKSTTMKMIACYTLPTSGTATVHNFDIIENPLEVKRKIGYLPENNPLYEDLYIREYLLFIARIQGLKTNMNGRINELIAQTGLEPEIKKKIGALSKGYRQRVGLAQALLHNPDVLLLDEPTSGLDPNQVVDIRNLIIEIGKEKTVLLSSHIMQEVQAMCNRVIILNNGKLVADNQTEALLNENQNTSSYRVRFKNELSKDQLKNIAKNPSISRQNEAWIISSTQKNLAEEIFNFAVAQNNPLIELSQLQTNLESVFQQLTKTSES